MLGVRVLLVVLGALQQLGQCTHCQGRALVQTLSLLSLCTAPFDYGVVVGMTGALVCMGGLKLSASGVHLYTL